MKTPLPFFTDLSKVKAILLGADPSNYSYKGKAVDLEYVFGINGKDKRYFQQIENNLSQIGLSRLEIYAQNLVQAYQPDETSKNTRWEALADKWWPVLKSELDSFDPARKIPILVTSERILEFLSLEPLPTAKEIYTGQADGIVAADENWLGRVLIPFYRHYRYGLSRDEYKCYRDSIRKFFN